MSVPYESVTIIFSPFHNGIYNHAVGAGPERIREYGLCAEVKKLGIQVQECEIDRVDDFTDDIGRSFEVFRRISKLVTAAYDAKSFPILISGNCGGTVGLHAGLSGSSVLKDQDVGCIWFDAHDDFNTLDTITSGYFDGMPVAIMAGHCWKAMRASIPGYRPLNLARFAHVSLRDLNELELERVVEAGYPVIWGNNKERIDYVDELSKLLDTRPTGPDIIHVDLDCLDDSVGQVNAFPPTSGGVAEAELLEILRLLPEQVAPAALTIASYDPSYDRNKKIVEIAVKGVSVFLQSLLQSGRMKRAEIP